MSDSVGIKDRLQNKRLTFRNGGSIFICIFFLIHAVGWNYILIFPAQGQDEIPLHILGFVAFFTTFVCVRTAGAIFFEEVKIGTHFVEHRNWVGKTRYLSIAEYKSNFAIPVKNSPNAFGLNFGGPPYVYIWNHFRIDGLKSKIEPKYVVGLIELLYNENKKLIGQSGTQPSPVKFD